MAAGHTCGIHSATLSVTESAADHGPLRAHGYPKTGRQVAASVVGKFQWASFLKWFLGIVIRWWGMEDMEKMDGPLMDHFLLEWLLVFELSNQIT